MRDVRIVAFSNAFEFYSFLFGDRGSGPRGAPRPPRPPTPDLWPGVGLSRRGRSAAFDAIPSACGSGAAWFRIGGAPGIAVNSTVIGSISGRDSGFGGLGVAEDRQAERNARGFWSF